MAESCALDPHQARKQHAKILQALSSKGQRPVAEALGVSEATISRMKADDLERFSGFLVVLGLKVVPTASECHNPEYLKHLLYFAKLGMDASISEPAPQQDWGDE